MRDYVKEIVQLAAEDEEAAFNHHGELVLEINQVIRNLEYQREAITSLGTYLRLKVLGEEEVDPVMEDIAPGQRSLMIRSRAQCLVQAGEKVITPQQVLDELSKDNLSLGVQQPTAVIGTVLASRREFRRIGENLFQYIGE